MDNSFSESFRRDSVVHNNIEPRSNTEGEYLTFASPTHHNYECLHGTNVVASLVVLTNKAAAGTPYNTRSDKTLLVRQEVCPPYAVREPDPDTKFNTTLTGMIENNDTPAQALKKEIREEAGLYDLSFCVEHEEANVPLWKPTTERLYFCIVTINNCSYEPPTGDGTGLEEMAKTTGKKESDIDSLLVDAKTDLLLRYALRTYRAR